MPETTFVKICGLSTPESVDQAITHGADAVGFVFAESVRKITPERAKDLVARVPNTVETVAVFRKQPIEEVIATARAAGVSAIQFHGREPFADLRRARHEGFRTLRAFGVDEFLAVSAVDRATWAGERRKQTLSNLNSLIRNILMEWFLTTRKEILLLKYRNL